jgi:hypothetical protein
MTTATLTHANGVTHPAPPLSLELLKRGPVSQWPRAVVPGPPAGARLLPLVATPRSDTATANRGDMGATARAPWWVRIRAIDADTVIAWSMAATVALVVVDAAIVSYSHIYGLATWEPGTGAETGVQARLLPLSIDGVIAEASLVKLYAARHKRIGKTKLATFMLILGIVATVAANVTHGLPSSLVPPVAHTVILALLSAWPAGALIGSVEMAMGLVRDKRAVEEGDTEGDSESDSETPKNAGQGGSGGDGDSDRKPNPRRRRRTLPDPVTAAIKKGWDDDKIVARLGVTKRTIQRRRKDLENAGNDAAPS